MAREAAAIRLECQACSWHTVCGPEGYGPGLTSILGAIPGKAPKVEILKELLAGKGPPLICPDCGIQGLKVTALDEAGDDRWQTAATCEACGKPIPPERLEAIPETTRCIACQEDTESGRTKVEPEFCPRCGAVLELRMSRAGGTTRFKLFCTGSPACRL